MAGKEGSEERLWLFGDLSPGTGEDEPEEEEAGKEEGPEEKLWRSGGLRRCTGRNKPSAADLEAGYEGPKEKLSMAASLRPCTGRSKLATAADEKDDKEEASNEVPEENLSMSGGLRPCAQRNKLEAAAAEAVIKEKGKAEAASDLSDGGIDVTSATNATVNAVSGDGCKAATPEVKFVEMPKPLIAWILSQKRETGLPKFSALQDNEENRKLIAEIHAMFQETEPMVDDFFEFQAWVRDKYKKNSRVMCPEDFVRGPIPGLQ